VAQTPSDDVADALEAARAAFARRDWPSAYDTLTSIERASLSADDLFALGEAAWWLGHSDDALAAQEEAYRLFLQGEEQSKAAASAMALAGGLFLRGNVPVASGWMSRAQRLLVDRPESVEHGYMMFFELEGAFEQRNYAAVTEGARRVQEFGERFGDPNLVAEGVMFEGRALVRQGRMREGMGLLDEVMVTVLSGELLPDWAGNIYCQLMETFHELADIGRLAEWAKRTERWLETLPSAAVFTGVCRVHRSQVLQVNGAWDRAEIEATRVCEDLATIHVLGAAAGYYQVGEIRRLRGDLAGAEESYSLAHQFGHEPQPGMALVRLAQGRTEDAAASIRAALVGRAGDMLTRVPLCEAEVEIAIAAGDVETARRGCEELEETSRVFGSSGLEAMTLNARGMVALAEGRADEALANLRAASTKWHALDAPYNAARAGALLALAYEELGSKDDARRELELAEKVFADLGAALDRERVTKMRRVEPPPGGLTGREIEVLALVADGRSNKEVAAALTLSEKTIARHLSNIFTKLGVASRTEAARYAYEHDLVSRG
jgi:ATP/maltotriose-dependent transcriptional regulator MalT